LLAAGEVALLLASPAAAGALGANKFDLMLDYVAPSPPAGANPEGYRRLYRDLMLLISTSRRLA